MSEISSSSEAKLSEQLFDDKKNWLSIPLFDMNISFIQNTKFMFYFSNYYSTFHVLSTTQLSFLM